MTPEGRRDSIDRFLEVALGLFSGLDPEAEGAVDRMLKINKHLERQTERTVGAYGLNTGEFKTLLKLRQVPGQRMPAGGIAEMLCVSSGAMTNRLDNLEESGYVERHRDPEDRRSVVVTLTAAGEEIVGRAVADQAAIEAALIGSLSPSDQRRLNSLLRTLVLAIEDPAAADRARAG